ncbi:MAG: hypothetical protein M1834_004376 [Cirrosporium novae-zelandiae]|nr:MAG: hypothetical protein M1834_004376 [Cirrosporium novae-zelandiae]
MPPQKALITGATGLLGRQVVKGFERAGWETYGTGFSRAKPPSIIKVNLLNEKEVEEALETINTAWLDEIEMLIITPSPTGAANRMPDKCDSDPDGARALNVKTSAHLAHVLSSRGIFLIYISTDYVFPGRPGEAPYVASSSPEPTNLYGQTKLDGEVAALEATKDTGLGVVLRVPVLYGEADKGADSAVNVLVDTVWKAAQVGEKGEAKIKMDDWAIRYPTNTEDVGRVCADVAAKYLESPDRKALPKVLQFSSEDKYTKYEMCQVFAEILGLPIDGMEANKEGNDLNAAVQRPYDCHLSTQELKDLGIDVSTMDFKGWWKRELRAFRK